MHTIENKCNMFFFKFCAGSMAVIWWLDYVNCTCNLIVCFISGQVDSQLLSEIFENHIRVGSHFSYFIT